MSTRKPANAGTIASLAVVTLIAACGQTESPNASPNGPQHAPTETHAEHHEPQPRLVVATTSGVQVLQADDGHVLEDFETVGRPMLSLAGDGRHVFLVQSDADVTNILDAGSWAVAHGDHAHYYTGGASMRESRVEGDTPVHVVSHGDRTAVFHDGDGTAAVFEENGMLIDTLDTTVVNSGGPHHGVVVPTHDGAIVSIPPPPGDDTLPTGVAIVDDAGAEIERFENCPGLHGEATAGDLVAFACEDGVLLVDGTDAQKIDYPSDEGRIGSFTPGPVGDILVGDYTDTSLLAVNVTTEKTLEIDLNEPYAARALDEHGDAVVLTTDGNLHVVDPDTGKITQTVRAVLPTFEIPEDWQEPRPTLAIAGHTAFVADPATSTVIPVDLDVSTVGTAFRLDDEPTGVVAVGVPVATH